MPTKFETPGYLSLNKPIQEKKIFITGGTSRLGDAFVRRAVAAGARVFFSYYTRHAAAEALVNLGARAYALDLNDNAAFPALAGQLKKDAGSLDALIHNAASVCDGTLQTLSEDDWDSVLKVDLKAPAMLTRQCLPLLVNDRKRSAVPAKIIFLTSRAAFRGNYGAANYAAAKAGLLGLMKSLALELAEVPVLVNAVNPGFMISRMTEKLPEKVLAAQRAASPLGRESNPEEVADFLVYLLSDKMSQVTGQIFHWESRGMVF